MWRVDRSVLPIELDRRDIDLVGAQPHGAPEVITVAPGLELGFGRDPDGVLWPHAVGPRDLPATVGGTDQADLTVSRIGGQLTAEALAQRAAPLGHRRDAERIYTAASRPAPYASYADA